MGTTWRLAAMECGENHRFALAEQLSSRVAFTTGRVRPDYAGAGGAGDVCATLFPAETPTEALPLSANAYFSQAFVTREGKAASSRTHSTAAAPLGGGNTGIERPWGRLAGSVNRGKGASKTVKQ